MKHWVMRAPIYYPDIHPSSEGKAWDYSEVIPDELLNANDIVYLVAGYGELYGWGMVTKIETYLNSEGKEVLKVRLVRPVVRQFVALQDEIKRIPTLARLFETWDTNLAELRPSQVDAFNQFIRAKGFEAPKDIELYNPHLHFSRLKKIYTVANGGRTKLIELTEALGDDRVNEREAWDEADFMAGEGWIEIIGDNGPPLVRLTHKGIKTIQESVGSSVDLKDATAPPTIGPASHNLLQWAGTSECILAIVFSDIYRSTDLQSKLSRKQWIDIQDIHRQQARSLADGFHGFFVKHIGDACMVVFKTGSAALQFAIELYTNTGHPLVLTRIAINSGEVEISEDGHDLNGLDVNFTSRMASIKGEEEGILVDNSTKRQFVKNVSTHANEYFTEREFVLAGFGNEKLWKFIHPSMHAVYEEILSRVESLLME